MILQQKMTEFDKIFDKDNAELAIKNCFKQNLLNSEHYQTIMKRKITFGNLIKLNDRYGLVANKKEFLINPKMFEFIKDQTFEPSHKAIHCKNNCVEWLNNFVVIAYDCEMDSETQEVVLVSFCLLDSSLEKICYVKEFPKMEDELCMYTFNFDDFCDFVMRTMKQFYKVFMVAHNGAKFDHFWVCERLQEKGVKFDFKLGINKNHSLISSGEGFLLNKQSDCESTIYFRDTYRFYGQSLANCGKFLNCEKLESSKSETGYINITKENARSEQNILYCCRDTKIVVLLLRWLRGLFGDELVKNKMCDSKNHFIHYNSQADIAYNLALTHVIHSNLFVFDRIFTEEIKRSLYGARVDSMIYGREFTEKPIQGIDVRSMYPASLNRPIRGGRVKLLSFQEINQDQKTWSELPTKCQYPKIAFVVLSKTAVDCYDKFFGILPVKVKRNGTLITVYASEGRIAGWYTDIDIFNAIRDGWKLEKILQCFQWEFWITDLSNFYRNAYENRKKHPKKDDPINIVEKIKMNSSYGKFGQIQNKLDWLDDLDEGDIEDTDYLDLINENNDQPYSPITVCIDCLSHSRIQMCTLKQMCKGKTIFYTDTDSLYLTVDDVNEIKSKFPQCFENKLSTDLEVNIDSETIYEKIIVLGKKLYCCGDEKGENKPLVHAKGHNLKDVNYSVMKKVLAGDYITTSRSSHINTYWYYGDEFQSYIVFNKGKWITMERRIQLSVPPFKYLCKDCHFWHTSYIDNCNNVY